MATKTLKLSADSIQILKVMSTINNSMAFKAGNELKTISASGSIVMESVIGETFPVDFNIYELNKFLSVLSLSNFKDAELQFDDEDETHMVIKSGSAKIKFFFSPEAFVQHPGKSIKLPKVDVTLDLTQEVLDNFQKAASALGHKVIKFKVEDKNLSLVATSEEIDTSNDYVVDLGPVDADDFDAKIKLENMKLLPGDYTVQLLKMTNKGIARFEHLTRNTVSFIGLEVK